MSAPGRGLGPPSGAVAETLRLLLVEDNPDDAELLVSVLERAGMRFELERADDARSLIAALSKRSWDVVVSDYSLPGFSGLEALRLVREAAPRLPFIIVSGTVGEEVAVRTLLAGADDYLLKDRLTRLPLAIEQARHRRSLESAYASASSLLEEKDLLARAALASLPALIAVLDRDGTVVGVNEVWLTRAEDLPTAPHVGRNLVALLRSIEVEGASGSAIADGIFDVLSGVRTSFEGEYGWNAPEGELRWVRLSAVPLKIRSGGAVVAQEDITAEVNAHARSDLAAAAFSSMTEAVVVLDGDLEPLEWNDAFTRMSGDDAPLDAEDGPLRILREALQPPNLVESLRDSVRERTAWTGQFSFIGRHGRLVVASATLAPILGQVQPAPRCVLVADDITELRAAQGRLEYVAYHDELTGLWNRVALKQRFDGVVARQGAGGVHLLLVGVNLIRLINENLGQEVGDQYLCAIAKELRKVLEPLGFVGRVGGDEFALLLENSDTDPETAARAVFGAFDNALVVAGHSLNAALSVATASSPDDGNTFEDLQRCADIALQHAKQGRHPRFATYQRWMRANVERNLWTSVELPKALRARELFMEYQPIMRLSDHRTLVVEALARWTHPKRGRIGPGEFVEAADEVGLARELGTYLIDRAVGELAAWRSESRVDLRIASNVSSALLISGDFVGEIDRILAAHRLPPNLLELEITESALMADLEHAGVVLRELRQRDIVVAIDDFGTGYSSLAYLRRLPVDVLKIAKQFVDRLPGDAEDRSIAEAVVHLARALGMRTVAEGVETREQLGAMTEIGCDAVQGYLIARPMPGNEVLGWIESHRNPSRHLDSA
jgi:diguanylate cyclase (GGDEF)-like protein